MAVFSKEKEKKVDSPKKGELKGGLKRYKMWRLEKTKYNEEKQEHTLERVRVLKENVVLLPEQAEEFNLNRVEGLKELEEMD